MKWMPQKFADSLAVIMLVGVPALWVSFPLPETIVGATIAAWALVVQFYFRKAEPKS